MSLIIDERETHFWYIEALDKTYAETTRRVDLTKLKRSGWTFVGASTHDGVEHSWRFEVAGYHLPTPRMRQKRTRVLTEEQRTAAAERLRRGREGVKR